MHAGSSASLALLLLTAAWAQGEACGPSPEVRSQLGQIKVVVAGPLDFDRGLAPLLALRRQHPSDLWVNLRYQDAIQQYGIEGHLRKLTEEYQVLSMQHSDEVTYTYLYARSLMGRNTLSAIQQMTKIIASHPGFAPAHASLAEMYSSTAFHDESREKAERERLLALCPGYSLQQRPAGLPDPSPLVDQAERLLAQQGNPDRIAAPGSAGDSGRRMAAAAYPALRLVQRGVQTSGAAPAPGQILESMEPAGPF